jgi:hypothetical protein
MRCGAPLGVLAGFVAGLALLTLGLCKAAAAGDRMMGEWSR